MKVLIGIVLFAVLGACSGILLDSSVFLLLLSSLLFTYASLFFIDLYRSIQKLRLVLGERSARGRVDSSEGTPFTTAGDVLQPLISGVLYQLTTLEDELLSASVRRPMSSGDSDESTNFLTGSSTLEDTVLRLALNCGAVAAGLAIGDALAGLQIESSGVRKERFEKALRRYLRDYYRKRDESCFGLFDTYTGAEQEELFGVFGFRFLLCFPVSLRKQSASAVFVLGFDAHSCPSPRTMDRIRERISEVYKNFVANEERRLLEKRAEEAESQERAASQFVAHMSHDIRSPLNNIKAVVSILEEEYDGQDGDLFLIARKNCDSLEEMVEGILDFNKSAAGQLHACRQTLDLSQLVSDVAQAFAIACRQKSLDLQVAVSSARVFVFADPHQIRRVITNLVSNAVKYTDVGSIHISLETAADDTVRLLVKDTGCGMSAEQVERMFNAFERFDESRQGVGLGLTVTRILAELNEGSIRASSTPGTGTDVEVIFPAAESLPVDSSGDAPAIMSVDLKEIVREGRGRVESSSNCPRVLIVDDDEDSVHTLQRSLSQYELDLYVATSVSDAVAICNFGQPDVVITDDHMPGGGGARVVSFLSQHAARAHVLVLSGSSEEAIGERYRSFSSVSIFQKPTPTSDLLAAIAELLAQNITPRSSRESQKAA